MSRPPEHYRESVRARWKHRNANPETRRVVRTMLRHLRHAIPRERKS